MRRPERGLALIEVVVGIAIMGVVATAIAGLVGTAVRSKMISSTQVADTDSARTALNWMADRLRNAGLNLEPDAQAELRCKDRVVALDPNLLPTVSRVFVSGELFKSDAAAGDEALTLGYYLTSDPETGNSVVMEYRQPCSAGPASLSQYSSRLTSPRLNITGLRFQYYDANGAAVDTLGGAAEIRKITAIVITLTVGGVEGRSEPQTVSLSRSLLFWNAEPNRNHWVNLNENY
jgi:prepilin-type N-terminal cleavage/methylation domain-containing protein